MKLNGAQITIKLIERQGIDCIAGIPGGANLPLYNALYSSKIKHVLVRHEQAGGFIAQGMARTTGKAAVCFATSGPGVTNLLTAVADAKLDSIPIVAVTGQVPTAMIGTDAFQEVDTYGMSIPITKHNFLVRSAQELLTVVPLAFQIALSGRPGPVLIDIPKNVQNEVLEFEDWPEPGKREALAPVDPELIKKAAEMIKSAKRPILYAGGGAVHSGADALIRELSEKNNIPITMTLMGLGILPESEPLSLGMLGMHGSRSTNHLIDRADVLIALGARFDDRATGNVKAFGKNASILHIDIDRSEIDKIKKSNLSIAGDLKTVLDALLPLIDKNDRADWVKEVAEEKKKFPLTFKDSDKGMHPNSILKAIAELAGPDAYIATDVGQHQMWTAQAYPFQRVRQLITSGGLGTMGFGVPAAMGAALANPNNKVICISGDGSILMNIQELVTMAELDLDVKIIILNNSHLGLVRQQQELFYQQNYMASKFQHSLDFAAVAKAFGVESITIEGTSDIKKELATIISKKGPALIDLRIDSAWNVLPMVAPGASNMDMID